MQMGFFLLVDFARCPLKKKYKLSREIFLANAGTSTSQWSKAKDLFDPFSGMTCAQSGDGIAATSTSPHPLLNILLSMCVCTGP